MRSRKKQMLCGALGSPADGYPFFPAGLRKGRLGRSEVPRSVPLIVRGKSPDGMVAQSLKATPRHTPHGPGTASPAGLLGSGRGTKLSWGGAPALTLLLNTLHPVQPKLFQPPTPPASPDPSTQSPTAAAIAGPYNAATAARDDGVPLSPATSGADTTPWQV